MNWAELLNRMAHWQRMTFTKATCDSSLEHAIKETKELSRSPAAVRDAEEWADLLHFAIQGGTLAAGSLNKFKNVVEAKLEANMHDRTWPDEPDAQGVYEHIKG